MNIADIVNGLPAILMYVVPGFLILRVSHFILPETKGSDTQFLIRSLVFSTILVQAVSPCFEHFGLTAAKGLGLVLLLIFSVILGVLRGLWLQSLHPGDLLSKIGIVSRPHASVWNQHLRKSQWVRAYLDSQGVMYEGCLETSSTDPDNPTRELYLGKPKLYRLKKGAPVLVHDMSHTEGAGVLLLASNITRMEIAP